MKRFATRIIALILALASLFAVSSVLAFAADVPETIAPVEDTRFDPAKHLVINRAFDEGWDAPVGFKNVINKNKATIDYEEADDKSYNYFMRLEHGSVKGKGYLELDLKGRKMIQRNGMFIASFSIKADDICELGNIVNLKLQNADQPLALINVTDYNLYAFGAVASNLIGSLQDGDWYNIDVVCDWRDSENAYIAIYNDGKLVASRNVSASNIGVENISFGWLTEFTNVDEKNGMSICFDNVQVYQSPYLTSKVEVDPAEYGIFVDKSTDKTVPIYKDATEKTPEQVLNEALFMKLGVASALAGGKKEAVDCPPVIIDGEVMVSLEFILYYLNYNAYKHPDNVSYDVNLPTGETTYITVGRPTASVAGELVYLNATPVFYADQYPLISIKDIEVLFPGMDAMYDDMGLVIVYENITGDPDATLISREDNLETMLDMMKKFVFDIADGSTEADYAATGEAVYQATLAKGQLQHPYIIADQDTFDSLYAQAASNAAIQAYIAKADDIYNDMAETDANGYVGIKADKVPVNLYNDGINPDATNPEDTRIKDSADGYNSYTNALYEIEGHSEKLVDLAFAYQVTRDAKYAELAYDIMLALGEWIHWGPGYMVNCATATGNYAIAYDWLYNYIKGEYGEEAVGGLAATIYARGVSQGVSASKGEFCRFPRTSGMGDKYVTRTDSYNAICSSGMIIGALAIMGESAYTADACYLIGNNLRNLANFGLDQYAPDGSFIESVTYWGLGTNALMKTIMALESSAGTDLGFKDTWGLDSTFYYACYISNGAGEAWNYHEDGVGSIIAEGTTYKADTKMFYYAAALLGDNNLAIIRNNQLAAGAEATIFDIIFAPENVEGDVELELDYVMSGIDAFVSRDGWEADSMFVGIMGGANKFDAGDSDASNEVNGQIDSGNFIYENKGIKWIIDHGSDSYYALNYFGSYRFNYYRTIGEGHNVIIIPDIATGQTEDGNGRLYKTYIDSEGKGSYALIDNSNAYGTYSGAALRGMLITNDRETVVIQDEVARGQVGKITWVVNTYKDIVIDETGRTAYLIDNTNGTETVLRASIVSADDTLVFNVLKSNESAMLSGATQSEQRDIGDINRLVIQAKEVLSFNVAVVFEIVESTADPKPIGYTYTQMSAWDSVFNVEEDEGDVEKFDSKTSDFAGIVTQAMAIYYQYLHFTTGIASFHKNISHIRYMLFENGTLRGDGSYAPSAGAFDPKADRDLMSYYNDYETYYNEYTEYRARVIATLTQVSRLTDVLAGQ